MGGPAIRLRRATRVLLTCLLCVPSAIYLVACEFGDAHHGRVMAALLCRVLIIHPLGERVAHRLCALAALFQPSPPVGHSDLPMF